MFGTDRLRGLSVDDLVIAEKGGAIQGIAGVWDQHSSKQQLITGYSRLLSVLRPILNIPMSVAGFHPLPPPGSLLRMAHLAFCCVRDRDRSTLRRLISAACAHAFSKGCAFLVFSRHVNDPLANVPRMTPKTTYTSRLYSVFWNPAADRMPDSSITPHIESSML